MSIVLKENEKLDKKKVFYTGTDTLGVGYNLCYNADAIRSAEGETFPIKVTGAEKSAKTAADVYNARAWEVEKPTTANLKHYAGVVVEEYAGTVGPAAIEIYVPKARGQKVEVYSDVSNTIDVTVLSLQAGSYAAGSVGEGPSIGVAVQTIDRSSTAGAVQANLIGLSQSNQIGEVVSANSRTTVQLPTEAIWENFDLETLKNNPFAGSYLDVDFKRQGDFPDQVFVDATYAATAAGKTVVEGIYPGVSALGEMILFTTTDNSAAEGMFNCPITISGGKKWAFEARIKVSTITTAKSSFFIGLALGHSLSGNFFADGGATIQTEGSLGFLHLDADTTEVDLIYDETGQSINVHDNDLATLVADTYITVGLYFDGTDIQTFLNGVSLAADILSTDIDDADFPTAKVFNPVVAVKGGHGDDALTTVDWIRVAQLA